MTKYNQYIKQLRASGDYCFTTNHILSELHISKETLKKGIYRLTKKGDIASPTKGFYVIVPPEYRFMGCLPPEELIPLLMDHWKIDYYACLLTAALYHGASHQKPQIFQIMTNRQIKSIHCGKIYIEFIYKKSLKNLPLQNIESKTGYLKISTPELTAFDLLTYLPRAGGLNHIATVFSELVEAIKPSKLIALAKVIKKNSILQRLGYILEQIDALEEKKKESIILVLEKFLKKKRLSYIPIAREIPTKGFKYNSKWKIIENSTIESDL